MTTVAAPAAGATSAPAAPANGATSEAQAPAAGTTSAPPPSKPGEQSQAKTEAAELKRLKLRLGKNREVEKTPEELERDLQVLEGLRSERGGFQKERDAFKADMEAFKKNPSEYLKKQGISLAELARAEQAEAAELAKLSPEQQEIKKYKDELARRDAAEHERQQTEATNAKQMEHQQLVATTARTLDAAIKTSGLPRSGELLSLYAEVMTLAEHAGEPYTDPAQIVAAGERLDLARQAKRTERLMADKGYRTRNGKALTEHFKALTMAIQEAPELMGLLGKDFVAHVARMGLDAFKSSPTPIIQETPRMEAPAAPQRAAPSRTEWDVLDSFGG